MYQLGSKGSLDQSGCNHYPSSSLCSTIPTKQLDSLISIPHCKETLCTHEVDRHCCGGLTTSQLDNWSTKERVLTEEDGIKSSLHVHHSSANCFRHRPETHIVRVGLDKITVCQSSRRQVLKSPTMCPFPPYAMCINNGSNRSAKRHTRIPWSSL